MRSWLFPPQLIGRATEATPDQVVATGAAGGSWGTDPVDNDAGWRPAGSAGREIPPWTNEKARIYSVAAYRSNPMARAIIDTYTSFCVGDSGVTYQVTNPQVRAVVEEFWEDPRNQIGQSQELGLRSNLLLGETIRELMVSPTSGVVRYSPIEPATVAEITLTAGNPLWPDRVWFRSGSDLRSLRLPRWTTPRGSATVRRCFGRRLGLWKPTCGRHRSSCRFWTGWTVTTRCCPT